MRIALITGTSQLLGGVETVSHMLKHCLERGGHAVSLLSTDSIQRNQNSFKERLIGLPHLSAQKYGKSLQNFDFVIANGEFSWNISHPNAIALFHGSYYGLSQSLRPFLSFKSRLHLAKDAWVQKVGAKNKTVVTVSRFNRGVLEDQGIRVHSIIPNGVDTDRFQPQSACSMKRYLCVANQFGPLDRYLKGFDILDQLAEQGIDISCASNSRPSAKLKWIGKISQNEIHTIYPKFRALIFPSRFEGFGLAPLEAMACGIPIVMGPVGYAEEIKQEIPECVVDDWSPRSFIARLDDFEQNYSLLSKRCREFAEKHTEAIFQEKWLEFIENKYEVENKK